MTGTNHLDHTTALSRVPSTLMQTYDDEASDAFHFLLRTQLDDSQNRSHWRPEDLQHLIPGIFANRSEWADRVQPQVKRSLRAIKGKLLQLETSFRIRWSIPSTIHPTIVHCLIVNYEEDSFNDSDGYELQQPSLVSHRFFYRLCLADPKVKNTAVCNQITRLMRGARHMRSMKTYESNNTCYLCGNRCERGRLDCRKCCIDTVYLLPSNHEHSGIGLFTRIPFVEGQRVCRYFHPNTDVFARDNLIPIPTGKRFGIHGFANVSDIQLHSEGQVIRPSLCTHGRFATRTRGECNARVHVDGCNEGYLVATTTIPVMTEIQLSERNLTFSNNN